MTYGLFNELFLLVLWFIKSRILHGMLICLILEKRKTCTGYHTEELVINSHQQRL
jgi:hypothetical protein